MSHHPMITRMVEDRPSAEQLVPLMIEAQEPVQSGEAHPLVLQFEARISQLFMPPTVSLRACQSGTAALQLAFASLVLRKGAAVLVPAYAPIQVPLALMREGLVPVFMDVDESQWTITPQKVHQIIAEHDIQAVVAVSVLGQSLNMQSWADFADSTGMPVVVAAGQTLHHSPPVPGITVAYDLNGDQGLELGIGGLVVTSHSTQMAHIDNLLRWGAFEGRVVALGNDWVMSPYHAAVGLTQLTRWHHIQEVRRRVFHGLAERISTISPLVYWKPDSLEAMGVIQLESADTKSAVQLALQEASIEAVEPLASILPVMPAFHQCGVVDKAAHSRHLVHTLLAVPMHHQLYDWHLDRIQVAITHGLMVRADDPLVSDLVL